MGKGSSGGTTTTTQSNNPWIGAQPAMAGMYGALQDYFFGPQGNQYVTPGYGAYPGTGGGGTPSGPGHGGSSGGPIGYPGSPTPAPGTPPTTPSGGGGETADPNYVMPTGKPLVRPPGSTGSSIPASGTPITTPSGGGGVTGIPAIVPPLEDSVVQPDTVKPWIEAAGETGPGGTGATGLALDPNADPSASNNYGWLKVSEALKNSTPYEDRTGWMQLAKDRIAPLDPNISEAWALKEQLARGNNPTINRALNLGQKTLGGYFLNNNPYLDQTANKVADQIQARVNSSAGLTGRTGSGASQSIMNEGLSNAYNDLYSKNYQFERGLQQQMMGLTPLLEELKYANANTLGEIGNQRTQYQQGILNAPMNALTQYGGMLSGAPQFGSSTMTQPYSSNTNSTLGALAGMGIGAAMAPTGVGLAGMMPYLGLGSTIGGMGGSLRL